MSHFYSRIQGNRGEATRCGTKKSGMSVSAKSWNTSVSVEYSYDDELKENYITIQITNLKTHETKTVYHGPEDTKMNGSWMDL